MVRDQTDGYVFRIILLIFYICKFTHFVAKCLQSIYIKNRINILNNNGQTFQPHTSIDVLLLQLAIIAFSVVLKLGKYIVPYFHVTVALTSDGASRFAAAVFFTAVIVNLRTRTARACTMLPEVVFFSKTKDTLRCNADLFVPDLERFLIVLVNRRIQSFRVQSDYLGQKLPGPGDRFVFEIIAERKVTQHFKEGTMSCCFTYVLDIACTDTFLAGCNTCSWRLFCSCKVWFQRCHTGIDNQKTVIIVRNQ